MVVSGGSGGGRCCPPAVAGAGWEEKGLAGYGGHNDHRLIRRPWACSVTCIGDWRRW